MDFHRENKNRPREMSSKRPVPKMREVFQVKKKHFRDPRFDDLSGTFNADEFEENYSFIKDIREREKKVLQKELKNVGDDQKRKSEILFLLKRMKNQEQSKKMNEAKKEKEGKEREELMAAAEQGIKPYIPKKSEVKMKDLVESYKTLKKSGRLEKYLERKRKKHFCKDQKRFYK